MLPFLHTNSFSVVWGKIGQDLRHKDKVYECNLTLGENYVMINQYGITGISNARSIKAQSF